MSDCNLLTIKLSGRADMQKNESFISSTLTKVLLLPLSSFCPDAMKRFFTTQDHKDSFSVVTVHFNTNRPVSNSLFASGMLMNQGKSCVITCIILFRKTANYQEMLPTMDRKLICGLHWQVGYT